MGAIHKNDIVVIIGIVLANHIKKIEVDFVWDMVSIIKGSKDEKRSVIIRADGCSGARNDGGFFLRFEALVFG